MVIGGWNSSPQSLGGKRNSIYENVFSIPQ
jgi:hypothetical protein